MAGYKELQPKVRKKLSLWAKISIVILALILALAAAAAVAYLRYLYPTGRIGKIVPEVYAIRTHRNGISMGNFFLLRTGQKYIAIDAGTNSTETENELLKLGISANDVVAVFITHSDWDHIGSLNLFDGAIIYTGNTENSQFPDIPHQTMSDGEIVELSGVSIQCIYTPGHTIDSVCYLIDGKYLFVGDLLSPPHTARYNEELQILNMEKVLAIDGVEYVFNGHFGLLKNIRFFRWWF